MSWKAKADQGFTVYVKVHARPYLYQRHTEAYRRWIPHLPCATPELLFTDENHLLMVFAELPGTPLENTTLPLELELRAYERAGSVACVFHGLPHAPETSSGVDTVKRMRRAIQAADGLLSRETLRWAENVGTDEELFSGLELVPCHRDYSPRNWLVDPRGPGLQWSLIDFERSRYDLFFADLQRMWPDHWFTRPDRRRAFFRGYGRDLTAKEDRLLKLAVLRNCIGSVSWARENGAPAFEEASTAIIERLRREW